MVFTYNEPKEYRIKGGKDIQYTIDNNDCWICTSHAKPRLRGRWKYPVITRRGKFYRLSRYIYECEKGQISDGYFIMHTCDNPECINPHHLKQGTPLDNTRDMIDKGRKPIGEDVIGVKLTEEKVRAIRLDNRSLNTIAKEYGVSKKLILVIKQRKVWKHVE